jgi:hypothetical protein
VGDASTSAHIVRQRAGRTGILQKHSCIGSNVIPWTSASLAQHRPSAAVQRALILACSRADEKSKLCKIDRLSEALANEVLHLDPRANIASLRGDIHCMRCGSRDAWSARSALATRLDSLTATDLQQSGSESISFALLVVADLLDAYAAAKADSSASVTAAELKKEEEQLQALATRCLLSAQGWHDPVGTLSCVARICRHVPRASEHVCLDTLLPTLRSMYSNGKLSSRQLALVAAGIHSVKGVSFEDIAPARRLQEALLQSLHDLQPMELCAVLAQAAEICPRRVRRLPGQAAAALRCAMAKAAPHVPDADLQGALAGAAMLSFEPELVASWRRQGRGYGKDEDKWQRRLAAASVAAALADEWALAEMGFGGKAEKGNRGSVAALVRAAPRLKLPVQYGLAQPLAVASHACESYLEEKDIATMVEEVRMQGSPSVAEPLLLAAKAVFQRRGWQLPASLGGSPPKWRMDGNVGKPLESKATRSWQWGVAVGGALARAKPQIELEGFEEISKFSIKKRGKDLAQGQARGATPTSTRRTRGVGMAAQGLRRFHGGLKVHKNLAAHRQIGRKVPRAANQQKTKHNLVPTSTANGDARKKHVSARGGKGCRGRSRKSQNGVAAEFDAMGDEVRSSSSAMLNQEPIQAQGHTDVSAQTRLVSEVSALSEHDHRRPAAVGLGHDQPSTDKHDGSATSQSEVQTNGFQTFWRKVRDGLQNIVAGS